MAEIVNAVDAGIALERRGLRDRVYDLVLATLLGHDVEPGSRLSIDTLARNLNVSPTPVREALVMLERTGLVTREAHKGYRVAPPMSDGRLEALFDARLVLEGGATELAAADAAAILPLLHDALTAHRNAANRVEDAARYGEIPVEMFREYFDVDWNFHHLIFAGTHNPFLLDMSETISTRIHRMRQTVQTGVSDAVDAVAEHEAILDAFTLGDPVVAGAAMRAHIERVRTRSRSDSHYH